MDIAVLAQAADAGLADACGPDPSLVCDTVYGWTDSGIRVSMAIVFPQLCVVHHQVTVFTRLNILVR